MASQLQAGEIALPLSPDRTLQQVAVDDIGAFAALAFEHAGRWQDRAIELAGDERTLPEVAALFSTVLGREVRYTPIPFDQFEQRAGNEMARMWRWFEEAGYQADITELRGIYPRLTTFERWVQAQDWGALRGGGAGARL
jgi:uncharacterized protein YbjT (DUF2867 family)